MTLQDFLPPTIALVVVVIIIWKLTRIITETHKLERELELDTASTNKTESELGRKRQEMEDREVERDARRVAEDLFWQKYRDPLGVLVQKPVRFTLTEYPGQKAKYDNVGYQRLISEYPKEMEDKMPPARGHRSIMFPVRDEVFPLTDEKSKALYLKWFDEARPRQAQELQKDIEIGKAQHDTIPAQGEETPESTGTSFFSDGEIKPICTAQPGGARPAMADGGDAGDQGTGDQRELAPYAPETSSLLWHIDHWYRVYNYSNRVLAGLIGKHINMTDINRTASQEVADQRVREINNTITQLKELKLIPNAKDVSDGWHTFQELYDMRFALTHALFKLFHKEKVQIHSAAHEDWKDFFSPVWRSKQHSDGTMFDGMFIVGIGTEAGEYITFHYHDEFWGKFDFANTIERAPEWDGHTDKDVIERLLSL